jgi:hypothetical protein
LRNAAESLFSTEWNKTTGYPTANAYGVMMNKIFHDMHVYYFTPGRQKVHGKLKSFYPRGQGTALVSTRAKDVLVKLPHLFFCDGSRLEWDTYEEIEGEGDLLEALDFKPRKRKETIGEYRERRRKKFRWPYDMLLEDGTPNWKSKEFFGYFDKEKKLVQKLHEGWMTLKEMRKFMAKGKVNRLIGKMSVGEPAWIPPGIGRLVVVGDKFHLLYSRHEACLEHEKFCEVRFPWQPTVVLGEKDLVWKRSMPKNWRCVQGFDKKPLKPGAREYEIVECKKKQK